MIVPVPFLNVGQADIHCFRFSGGTRCELAKYSRHPQDKVATQMFRLLGDLGFHGCRTMSFEVLPYLCDMVALWIKVALLTFEPRGREAERAGLKWQVQAPEQSCALTATMAGATLHHFWSFFHLRITFGPLAVRFAGI